MNKSTIPFGILFEEQNTDCSQNIVTPEYDPIDGISYIIDSAGKRIPYVNWAWTIFGTQTFTNVRAEATDRDPADGPPRPTTTQTVTRIKGEATDTD